MMMVSDPCCVKKVPLLISSGVRILPNLQVEDVVGIKNGLEGWCKLLPGRQV